MSPQMKHDTRWILTVVGSIVAMLLTAVTLTAKVTTKFNCVDKEFAINKTDHAMIKKDIDAEVARSTKVDETRDIVVKEINYKLDSVIIQQAKILEAIKER